jgi:hypothetical protein
MISPGTHRLHFWNWEKRQVVQSIDLGATGMIPLVFFTKVVLLRSASRRSAATSTTLPAPTDLSELRLAARSFTSGGMAMRAHGRLSLWYALAPE